MCVRPSGDGTGDHGSTPWTVPRGLTFRDWLRSGGGPGSGSGSGSGGGPGSGGGLRPPTTEDLEYHLTTLFPRCGPAATWSCG